MPSSYTSLSEQDLLLLIKEGENDAFSEIYNRYKGVLYIHAYKMLGNREEAKDVVQEVFTAFWQKKEQLNITSLSAYLYKSVRNRILDKISHNKVENQYIESINQFAKQTYNVTDYAVRERELKTEIEKGINALPEKMKLVFIMSRDENLTHREIATQLNISEKTVKKQINNALKVLRVKLEHFTIFIFFIFF